MKYLKYFCEGLTPNLVEKARYELGETEEIREKALQQLKQLIKEEPDFFPCVDDAFLLRFLRGRKFNVDKAFKTLTNYYKFIAKYSGVLTDLTPSDLKSVIEQNYVAVVEYRDQNDIGMGIICPAMFDMEKYTLEQYIAVLPFLAEIMIEPEATQVVGYSFIFDCKNLGLNTIKFFAKPTLLYSLATGIEDCFPGRVKAYHAINVPSFAQTIYSLLKLFLSKKLQKRIHFHGSNLESLHKCIIPDILPEELGGKQGPFSKLAKQTTEILFSKENHFQLINIHGYKGKTLELINKKKTKVKDIQPDTEKEIS